MKQKGENEIYAKYEVNLVVSIILKNNFTRVAIQLPDCMLEDSLTISNVIQQEIQKRRKGGPHGVKVDGVKVEGVKVEGVKVEDMKREAVNVETVKEEVKKTHAIESIPPTVPMTTAGDAGTCCGDDNNCQNEAHCSDMTNRSEPNGSSEEIDVNIYILGDTSLNECCEDYVNAEHVQSDFLVHYGNACQSFTIPYIPSVYIFNEVKEGKEVLYKNVIQDLKRNKIIGNDKTSIILCDVTYTSCIPSLVKCFFENSCKKVLLATPQGRRVDNVDPSVGSSSNMKKTDKMRLFFHIDENIVQGKTFLSDGYNNVNASDSSENMKTIHFCKKNEEIERLLESDMDEIDTNIIVCLHKIANNMEQKTCYGFYDNYITLDMTNDDCGGGKYAFLCGRLATKIMYNVKLEKFIYKVMKKEELSSQSWETFINGKIEKNTNIFLFPNGNVNLKNRCMLEYGNIADSVYIYEEQVATRRDNEDGEAEKKKTFFIGEKITISNSHFEKSGNPDKLLLRRYNLIEKCKLVDTFGILVANVNLKKNKEIKNLINYMLKSKGKKCYTIATNKLNSAKLENFSDIQMYILITCPEKSFLELSDFSKKIINPCELFIAYGYLEWQCKYFFEFSHLLTLPSVQHILENMNKGKYNTLWFHRSELHELENNPKQRSSSKNILPNESSNPPHRTEKMLQSENNPKTTDESSNLLEKYQDLIDHSLPIPVEEQRKFITMFHEKSPMCINFLGTLKENASREYRGVDMNYNIDIVPDIVQGDDGIAQRYESDIRFCG
ncbi:diphthamide synthesis protein [Plasmodium gonderi]|uniref:Diphthamide synthesis protein n=1 Tax=Plasmodium gonderi TaxID=77519 RepID=A0A1Y1JKX4_PLAGO|nr:diphthamide synthesis protein [Plasmodium gonderi]GAW82940.1 diphthamide synthesis protein [Plasmodium gonderi]